MLKEIYITSLCFYCRCALKTPYILTPVTVKHISVGSLLLLKGTGGTTVFKDFCWFRKDWMNGLQCKYISDSAATFWTAPDLSSTGLLTVPRGKTQHREAAFSFWNTLPENFGLLQLSGSFKSKQKTYVCHCLLLNYIWDFSFIPDTLCCSSPVISVLAYFSL